MFQMGIALLKTPVRRVASILFCFAACPFAGEEMGTRELSLQDLLNLKVEVASKSEENLAEAPGVVTVITRREIEGFNAVSLVDVLNRAPSTQMLSSHLLPQAKASVRGLMTSHSDNHVLVLINGRPFRDALGYYSNVAVYTSFPVDLIERIEIVRGPGSVLYGSGAIAGVINIVTREAEKPASISVSGGGGSFGGKMASGTALLSWHDVKLVLGGNYFNEDGWDFAGKTKIGPLVQDSSMPYGEDNKAVAAFLEYKRFRAQFAYMDMAYDDLGIVPVWAAAGKSWSTRWFADLGYTQPLLDGWSAGFNVTRNSWDKHIISPPGPLFGGDNNDRSDATVYEGVLRGRLWEKGNLVAGIAAENRSNRDIAQVDSAVSQSPAIPVLFDEWLYSGYASVDYRFIDPLKLIAGFQYNRAAQDKEALVPRLGAIYAFTDDISLKLLYGQAFRVATPLEEYVFIPNVLSGSKDLDPEQVTTYDAQLFINTGKAQYTFTMYYSHLRDVMARVYLNPGNPGDLQETFANADQYDLYGAELEVKLPLTENLYGTGSMAYQRENEDRLFIPDFMGKGGLFYEVRGFTGGLFGSLFGRGIQARGFNPATEDLNPPAEPIFLLSVSLKYDLKKLTRIPVTMEAYGTNLFDDPMVYPEFSRNEVNTLPMGPGRAIYGRVSLKF
jgi:outer membrane receptor protein involved in Fe transport